LAEAARASVGRERDRRLVGLAFLEMTHVPRVGGVEALAQHARERLLAATFELDEGLRLVIPRERGGCAEAGRAEPIARRDCLRRFQRAAAIHRDVERDDREGLGEVADADQRGNRREQREGYPERGASHGRSSGAPLYRTSVASAFTRKCGFRLHAEVWLPPSGGRRRHSLRSATVGAIRVARDAGIRQATSEVTSSSATTDANVTGSIGLQPSNTVSSEPASSAAPTTPATAPSAVIDRPLPSIRRRTSRPCAPIAI